MAAHSAKRQTIIEAAIKRFGHFGIAKTTMAEIASDLSFSKGLLYYYFPDKQSLCHAALDYVIEQGYIHTLDEIKTISDVREAMLFFLEKRMEFVMQHYNLLQYSIGSTSQVIKDLEPVFTEARKKQEKLVTDVLKRAVKNGQIKPRDDFHEVSSIILFAIEGMRNSIIEVSEPFFPNKETFENIQRFQRKLMEVIVDGLMK